MVKSVSERFWPKVDKSGDCWLWTAALRKGYGVLRLGKRMQSAHRLSYELAYGHIPDGLVVDHICHVSRCVNPEHLRLATHKQNMENRRGPDNDSKSGVRGVWWRASSGKWVARVGHNGKVHHVGLFSALQEAEKAVEEKRRELFTHSSGESMLK